MAVDQKLDAYHNYQQIAKERLLWLVKPIFTVCLVTWCLHPSTTMHDVVDKNAQLGFLLGALFAILVDRETLYYYLVVRRGETTEQRNRMPDEYYFGKVTEVMQLEGE